MNLRNLMQTVSDSAPNDWELIFRPTYLHRFTEIMNAEGAVLSLDPDEHLVGFVYRPNISITMTYGMVETGNVALPAKNPYAGENARSVYLDIFYEGRLAHRELILQVDRHRCLLPFPQSWDPPVTVSQGQANLVRLVHGLAGPPTDYDSYFDSAGLRTADIPWP